MKTPSKKNNTADVKMAQGLSASDKQVLRDHAAALKKQGGAQAERELQRMNKMYSNYGMSFGSIKGA